MKTIKSKLTIATFVILLAGFTVACSNSNSSTESTDHEHGEMVKQYTCSMHPEVVKDEPGKCPICKMDLVEKTDSHESHEGHNH